MLPGLQVARSVRQGRTAPPAPRAARPVLVDTVVWVRQHALLRVRRARIFKDKVATNARLATADQVEALVHLVRLVLTIMF